MAAINGKTDRLTGNGAMPSSGIEGDSIHDYFHKGIGESVNKVITLAASGGSESVNIFQLTNTVRIVSIHGFVETATTFTNCTAAQFDLWDSTAAVALTKNDGVLSGMAVGTFFAKNAAATVTMAVANNATGVLTEGASLSKAFAPFFITQKTGANTYVRFTYTTSDAPIAATLGIHCRFIPESWNGTRGTLTAV